MTNHFRDFACKIVNIEVGFTFPRTLMLFLFDANTKTAFLVFLFLCKIGEDCLLVKFSEDSIGLGPFLCTLRRVGD